VPEKYKKKIELMVRKPDRGEEPPEGLSACPFCHLPGPETQLQCVSCQSIIPCDIATGEVCCAGGVVVLAS
jgi:WD repeat-containing protein 19